MTACQHVHLSPDQRLASVLRWIAGCLLLSAALWPVSGAIAAEPEQVDFQRQVRPILASKCFTCHGPDEAAREADLRLDLASDALADRGGYAAIQPGDHEASELWQRISTDDEDLRMPPPGPHEPLTPEQIETLARWIDQGAHYEQHWAFVPPRAPELPAAGQTDTAASPIDVFINARLAEAELEPLPPADPYTLVRRVYLDLIGIPPTPQEADAFASDPSPLAYGRLVDALLARPEYAERWARPWLDLARYADTNGYEKDRPRTIWPYRDWVLAALSADMPFDQFSIRQLAGDMLPEATLEDRIATGFHRNTMLNEEGGIDPEEFRFHAMTDRVATTGTVWMGLTVGCAQCHTHKYDPITHTDYYALFALLNGADDTEQTVADPAIAERRERLAEEIRQAEAALVTKYLTQPVAAEPSAPVPGDTDSSAANVRAAFEQFIDTLRNQATNWQVVVPQQMTTTLPILRTLDDGSILASGDVTKRDVYTLHFDAPEGDQPFTAIRLEALPHESLPAGGPGMAYYEGRRGDFFLSELRIVHNGEPVSLREASTSFGKISIGSGSADAANVIDGEGSTGWSTSGAEGKSNRWVANFEQPFQPTGPWSIEMVFERHYAAPLGRFRIALAADQETDVNGIAEPAEPQPAKSRVAVAQSIDADAEAELWRAAQAPAAPLSAALHDLLAQHFIFSSELLAEARKPIEALQRQMPEPVRTLVMRQRPTEDARQTYRYHRGEYLQPREAVEPAVPSIFAAGGNAMPSDRLELAQWLVSPANPLFARVTVDRAWRELLGRGIVDTAGDYGTQSEPPSHPQLLDYLAIDFADSGMSLKRLHRQLVLSDVYQRAAQVRPELQALDPDNRLLAKGPRRRLEGERIRDSLLAAAGLLTRRWGGPSVYPPQPQIVTAQAYGNLRWTESTGADRFRRSLYTFAKRTAPFAALSVFDGPTGETCQPRRDRSNTPLQALTLLNDSMFIEIAQALADDVRRSLPGGEPEQLTTEIFRRLLTRPPSDDELQAILAFHSGLETTEVDSWMLVARALMNLDETITLP